MKEGEAITSGQLLETVNSLEATVKDQGSKLEEMDVYHHAIDARDSQNVERLFSKQEAFP